MSEAPDWMTPQALPTLKQGKNVLAVEGDDDKDVYKAWLQKLLARGTVLSDTVVIVDAGSKDAVLEGLGWYTGEHRKLGETSMVWLIVTNGIHRRSWQKLGRTHNCWLTRVAIASRATSSSHPSLQQP